MEQRQRSITQQREEEKDNTDQILAKTGPAIAKLNEICKCVLPHTLRSTYKTTGP